MRARPVEGEANDALLKLLARSLGAPRSAVTLERGGQSRLKRVSLDGIDEAELRRRIDGIVTER